MPKKKENKYNNPGVKKLFQQQNKKLQNSFQTPGTENPLEQDITSKWNREQIVKRFLEERDGE